MYHCREKGLQLQIIDYNWETPETLSSDPEIIDVVLDDIKKHSQSGISSNFMVNSEPYLQILLHKLWIFVVFTKFGLNYTY